MKRSGFKPKKGRRGLKRGKRINPVSEKRLVENRERRRVLATHLKDYCEGHAAGAPGRCFGALHGHEVLTRARGGSITDPANIKTCCDWLNTALSQDPEVMAWGYENGFLRHAWD